MLATGSFDASVGIWRHYDADDLNPKPVVPGAAKGVDFDARDNDIDNYGEEEEDEEWRFAIVLDGHESEVKSVAWSAGGNLLATCSRDKSVWIWEEVGEDEFETVAVLQEHEGDVKCVSWHPEEELLASASYDDDVRLWREDVDDWGCCAVLRGHESTVWNVCWEPVASNVREEASEEIREVWTKRREASGPRLLSCSDDLTIRVWRRRPKEKVQQSRLSIIRSGSAEEDWIEEVQLPKVHSRSIYAVGWNKKSGRIVSAGGDGLVVVYEERWKKINPDSMIDGHQSTAEEMNGGKSNGVTATDTGEPMDGITTSEEASKGDSKDDTKPSQPSSTDDETLSQATEWIVIAKIESAHDVFEVNHVAWAPRPTSKDNIHTDQEDMIITTGDDGVVNVWSLDV